MQQDLQISLLFEDHRQNIWALLQLRKRANNVDGRLHIHQSEHGAGAEHIEGEWWSALRVDKRENKEDIGKSHREGTAFQEQEVFLVDVEPK
jgi:hypothetical protein